MLSETWETVISFTGSCFGVILIIQRLRLKCQRCGEPFREIQFPQSFRQALLGRYICPACGSECDGRGRVVMQRVKNQDGGTTSR
jgi:Zn finger protein HypA/HybF involved in hydrogenase expression